MNYTLPLLKKRENKMDQLKPTRTRHRCSKCKKRKEEKYMDQFGPKWQCKNCKDENRAYGRQHSWRKTKI